MLVGHSTPSQYASSSARCRPRRPNPGYALLVACAALTLGAAGAQAQPVNVRLDGVRLLVDEQPVFPLAIYVANAPRRMSTDRAGLEAALDDLADSPFHILVNYGGPEGSHQDQTQYLDALAQRGLREIYSLKDYYAEGMWGASPYLEGRTEQAALAEEVGRLKRHPAILGWYLSDEERDARAVRRHDQWVREADPSRFTLTLVNLGHVDQIAPFRESGDVLAVDAYPVGGGGRITDVVAHVDALVSVTAHAKPAWFVVQAHGGYAYRSDFRDIPGASVPLDAMRTRGRAPTPREMRAMTFLALTHGATGIVFCYYKDIQMAFDREQRWAAVKAIGEEVQRLALVLLTPDIDPRHILSDNEQVHWMAKANPRGVDLVAVNAAAATQSVKLRLPVQLTGASVRSGSAFVHSQGDEVLLIMDGYEAVTVELTTTEPFDWSRAPQAEDAEAEGADGTKGGGYWRFEEQAGAQVRDTLGPGLEGGVLSGKIARADTIPPAAAMPDGLQSRRSLEFTGDPESCLIMDAVDELDVGTRDFTLEAWVQPRSAESAPAIAGKGISGNFADRGFELRAIAVVPDEGPGYYIQFGANSLDRSLRSESLPYNTWQHVAVTRKRQSVRLYVGGRLVDEALLTPPADLSSRQRFAIGCIACQGTGVPGNQFDGYIDEVRLVIGEALAPGAFLCRSAAAGER